MSNSFNSIDSSFAIVVTFIYIFCNKYLHMLSHTFAHIIR
jgi:hypothetical protein